MARTTSLGEWIPVAAGVTGNPATRYVFTLESIPSDSQSRGSAVESADHYSGVLLGDQARERSVLREVADAASVNGEPATDIPRKAKYLLGSAAGQFFEDGMETDLSRGLVSMIQEFGGVAVVEVAHLILREDASPDVASEALRWIGRLQHRSTYDQRLWLLCESLKCASPKVRDGAVLGLASMDDAAAIPHIRSAIGREDCRLLAEDMQQALRQLESKE